LSYNDVTERIINDIVTIEKKVDRGRLKRLVLELADHLNDGIKENRPEIIAKLKTILAEDTKRPRGQDGITPKLISLLIQKIARKNFQTISAQWISMCLPDEYKESREFKVKEKMIHASDISDANLLQMSGELKKRMRGIDNLGPAKEIKVKNDLEHVENHNWKCDMSNELVKLAIKLNNEHEKEHNPEYCKNSAKTIRIARDKRFATTFSRYQAIVVCAEHTRSLADLAGDEVEVLSRWEVHDNEKNCKECIDLIHCRAEKCNHICHQFKKEMTTKGIKWAERETQELADLKKHMYLLYEDSDDMCDFMKVIFKNPSLKMTQGDKKNIMAKHISKDDCDQCLYHTTNVNPNFFKDHL